MNPTFSIARLCRIYLLGFLAVFLASFVFWCITLSSDQEKQIKNIEGQIRELQTVVETTIRTEEATIQSTVRNNEMGDLIFAHLSSQQVEKPAIGQWLQSRVR
ncbi:hypothetical protein L0152_31890 [bacterium]|nr:hypothetical protein [bacterium]